MKRIDLKQIDLAWNLYENMPKSSTIRSIVNHRNSVLPNSVRIRVESILQEAQQVIDEDQETDNKDDSTNHLQIENKIAEISQRHLALAMAEQFKDQDLVDLLSVNSNQKSSEEMIMDKAPTIREHGLSMVASPSVDVPMRYASSETSTTGGAGSGSPMSKSNGLSIKGGDILSSMAGITPAIADSIEATIMAKTINRIIIAVAEMADLPEPIIIQLKDMLDNVEHGVIFAEKFRKTVEMRYGKKLTITDLFELLKDSKDNKELFVIVVESLELCLLAALTEYSMDFKEQLSDALVWNLKERAKDSFWRELGYVYCRNIALAIVWRIVAVIVIIIGIISMVISIVLA
eukprot:CAMPEP_0201595790 /NCGR_PEP_ID=MMETSP0190_2-20130828/192676_1 /ASSEMBLY_ACC=CAM_ASM_000263 /TAXON_ID=37353 /ORGANISM="Rosalina sp." /LENGTH=346 /DNA_ID=CAMNT_0048055889 /DNA_START=82 /DNA_END=1120 /DNA_ORIENTATION=-